MRRKILAPAVMLLGAVGVAAPVVALTAAPAPAALVAAAPAHAAHPDVVFAW